MDYDLFMHNTLAADRFFKWDFCFGFLSHFLELL